MTLFRAGFVVVLGAAAAWAVLAWRTDPPAAGVPEATPQSAAQSQGRRWLDADRARASGPARAMDGAPWDRPARAAIYGRNGRTIDFGGLDAAAYIDARAAAARTGDLKAAYQVYQAESACAASDEPLPDFLDPAEGDAATRERARVRALCARVSPMQRQERMRFLQQAADGGNRDAGIDFYMEGPRGKPPADTDPLDPQVRQWQAQAVGYLKQAGAACDPFALGLLENGYDAGQFGPRDVGQAMAYAVAAGAARRKPVSEDALRARFGDDLAPADVDAALQRGAQLAGASCPAAAAP
jgi:hypothetical protein